MGVKWENNDGWWRENWRVPSALMIQEDGKKKKGSGSEAEGRAKEKVESSESEVKARMSGTFKTQILEMWKN